MKSCKLTARLRHSEVLQHATRRITNEDKLLRWRHMHTCILSSHVKMRNCSWLHNDIALNSRFCLSSLIRCAHPHMRSALLYRGSCHCKTVGCGRWSFTTTQLLRRARWWQSSVALQHRSCHMNMADAARVNACMSLIIVAIVLVPARFVSKAASDITVSPSWLHV